MKRVNYIIKLENQEEIQWDIREQLLLRNNVENVWIKNPSLLRIETIDDQFYTLKTTELPLILFEDSVDGDCKYFNSIESLLKYFDD